MELKYKLTVLNSEQKVEDFHYKIAFVPDKKNECANQLTTRSMFEKDGSSY